MRRFIAIEIPPPVQSALAGLCPTIPGLRRTPTHQLHLTLRFLGDLDDDRTASLHSELNRIRQPAFSLTPSGAGTFPERGTPRVLWIAMLPQDALHDLVKAIDTALEQIGIPPENRPYHPHVTLARNRSAQRSPLLAWRDRYAGYQGREFPVNSFTLFSSQLTPTGAIHTPETRWPLPAT